MRGTQWGQGYSRPTGLQCRKAPHTTFNFNFFTLVYGSDEGLIQSATCTERQQKENIICVVIGDLSFSFIVK